MSENVWRAPGPGDSRAAANASYLPYQPPAEEEAEQRPPPGPAAVQVLGTPPPLEAEPPPEERDVHTPRADPGLDPGQNPYLTWQPQPQLSRQSTFSTRAAASSTPLDPYDPLMRPSARRWVLA